MPEILIPGPEGRVEANYLPSNKDGSRVALILHPDPSRGGTMNTKVVFNLFKCFYVFCIVYIYIYMLRFGWFFLLGPFTLMVSRLLRLASL